MRSDTRTHFRNARVCGAISALSRWWARRATYDATFSRVTATSLPPGSRGVVVACPSTSSPDASKLSASSAKSPEFYWRRKEGHEERMQINGQCRTVVLPQLSQRSGEGAVERRQVILRVCMAEQLAQKEASKRRLDEDPLIERLAAAREVRLGVVIPSPPPLRPIATHRSRPKNVKCARWPASRQRGFGKSRLSARSVGRWSLSSWDKAVADRVVLTHRVWSRRVRGAVRRPRARRCRRTLSRGRHRRCQPRVDPRG